MAHLTRQSWKMLLVPLLATLGRMSNFRTRQLVATRAKLICKCGSLSGRTVNYRMYARFLPDTPCPQHDHAAKLPNDSGVSGIPGVSRSKNVRAADQPTEKERSPERQADAERAPGLRVRRGRLWQDVVAPGVCGPQVQRSVRADETHEQRGQHGRYRRTGSLSGGECPLVVRISDDPLLT